MTKPKTRQDRAAVEPEMRAEYDFTGAVRGKYYQQYIKGPNVVVFEPSVATESQEPPK